VLRRSLQQWPVEYQAWHQDWYQLLEQALLLQVLCSLNLMVQRRALRQKNSVSRALLRQELSRQVLRHSVRFSLQQELLLHRSHWSAHR
jgi:hypothetical protein